ncbi:hypothetical protein IVB30_20085 [Bradyrhizobium sp. 200]|uniref:hypothetical protein n=1 Tax=Bradyrhizobium sp. 200 TaxID=2782665 RepID=UPI001FFE70BD|nr:hypothetical protein [Bradyrhizobium sp. 200]UPJ53408.1 hypothetical protein IVB30_20085 [Bradyrhizobium sp. 200]
MPVNKRLATIGDADLFVSAKTRTAVPARHPLLRDALAQASLDPQVRSINYVPSTQVESETVKLGAIVVIRDNGHYYLDLVPARRPCAASERARVKAALTGLGLRPLVLTETDILREPRFANSRIVWEYARVRVPIGVRLQVLNILVEDGPMRLGLLLAAIRHPNDPAPAVMALACHNLIELDLVSMPLGPGTMARARV